MGSAWEFVAEQEDAHFPAKDCAEQVLRIVQSSVFRNSMTSQILLKYVADKTLSAGAGNLKEYTIGVEALGRKPDFDPKIDPIVRVQSHRLRVKLREYYEAEGASDAIWIRLPKGHYGAVFAKKPAILPSSEMMLTGEVAEVSDSYKDQRPGAHGSEVALPVETTRGLPVHMLVGSLIVLMIAIAAFSIGDWHARRRAVVSSPADPVYAKVDESERSVKKFWASLLGSDVSPVIAYPDAVFLLDDSNDLFRFRRGATDSRGAVVDPHLARDFASNPAIVAQAGKLYYENGYTGTGELESIAMLTGLFGRMGIRPTIKASLDISPDDLSHHNVILLGSPFQNAAVAKLLPPGDFTYKNPDDRHEQWRAQIVDNNPQSGQLVTYGTERDRVTQELKTDYSLITVVRGAGTGKWIAILGGLDTKGTEGATMFATSERGVETLEKGLKDAGALGHVDSAPFQALLRVRLAKGYQVLGYELVAVRNGPTSK